MKQKRVPEKRKPPEPPTDADRWASFLTFCESYTWSPILQNSYVLSRLWAWFSRIEISPKVKIPLPRMFTYRDP